MSLVLLVALPFLASLLAALLPANARNAESTLAGVIAPRDRVIAGVIVGAATVPEMPLADVMETIMKMFLVDLVTAMPICCTTCGSVVRAVWILFWT